MEIQLEEVKHENSFLKELLENSENSENLEKISHIIAELHMIKSENEELKKKSGTEKEELETLLLTAQKIKDGALAELKISLEENEKKLKERESYYDEQKQAFESQIRFMEQEIHNERSEFEKRMSGMIHDFNCKLEEMENREKELKWHLNEEVKQKSVEIDRMAKKFEEKLLPTSSEVESEQWKIKSFLQENDLANLKRELENYRNTYEKENAELKLKVSTLCLSQNEDLKKIRNFANDYLLEFKIKELESKNEYLIKENKTLRKEVGEDFNTIQNYSIESEKIDFLKKSATSPYREKLKKGMKKDLQENNYDVIENLKGEIEKLKEINMDLKKQAENFRLSLKKDT